MIDITMGYRLNPECVIGLVSSDDVDDDGIRRDAQPKYTPDLISAIHGVSLLSTGRLAVGMPRFLEPRP